MAVEEGGVRTGVLKGVVPLQGVTGAPRRREGAWPPSGSAKAAAARLRIPTLSAITSRAVTDREWSQRFTQCASGGENGARGPGPLAGGGATSAITFPPFSNMQACACTPMGMKMRRLRAGFEAGLGAHLSRPATKESFCHPRRLSPTLVIGDPGNHRGSRVFCLFPVPAPLPQKQDWIPD